MKNISALLAALTILAGAALPADAQTVLRGPYLQRGSHNQVIVRWRTDSATDSRVRTSTSLTGTFTNVDNSTSTTEHEVTLSGLTANTKYFYSIGSTSAVLSGPDANTFFVTSPTPGVAKNTRVWVLGDAGTNNSSQKAVRDAYYGFAATRHTDLWLMLGDNAYTDGTDAEYQNAVFGSTNAYATMLRKSVLWSTMGNHEGHTADSLTQTGPYYSIFTFPKNGEAGGLASGTEAYYSFDYGNIHFICLESYQVPGNSSAFSTMKTWLTNDLNATPREWIVAFWHHPPYSHGSHNSDTDTLMKTMREQINPILEQGGVDLVLSGHSHAYERTYLIDGHYGTSDTFTAAMKVDGGSGRDPAPYQKGAGTPAHDGAVYIVAGSSGQASGGTLDHKAMFISLNNLGSLVLDIDGSRLDARFLRETGTIADYFTIVKGSPPAPLPAVTIAATDASASETGPGTGTFTITRTGSTTSSLLVNFTIGGTATAGSDYTTITSPVTIAAGSATKTVTVTPVDDGIPESSETVVLTITTGSGYNVGSPSSATVTIADNDPPPADADGDGLPDAWEVTHFGNTTSQNGSGDPDGDGATNQEEFQALTDPMDPASKPPSGSPGGGGGGACGLTGLEGLLALAGALGVRRRSR
jgi:calcineurin-like phosphoesterase family protein/Calx-beta domain-containing protein/purple acid phosphatase-like protein/thrombospondin type 3 repeat protein